MDMRRFWMDLGYGARGLRNQPGFAAIAILTLALGIGASTTIFSVIYNVLLDPFPYTDAKRVVAIQIHDLATGRAGGRQLPLPEMFIPYTNDWSIRPRAAGPHGDESAGPG